MPSGMSPRTTNDRTPIEWWFLSTAHFFEEARSSWRFAQLLRTDIMLIQSDAYVLRIDLYQLAQRIL